jgi:hypothetical protein
MFCLSNRDWNLKAENFGLVPIFARKCHNDTPVNYSISRLVNGAVTVLGLFIEPPNPKFMGMNVFFAYNRLNFRQAFPFPGARKSPSKALRLTPAWPQTLRADRSTSSGIIRNVQLIPISSIVKCDLVINNEAVIKKRHEIRAGKSLAQFNKVSKRIGVPAVGTQAVVVTSRIRSFCCNFIEYQFISSLVSENSWIYSPLRSDDPKSGHLPFDSFKDRIPNSRVNLDRWSRPRR